MQKEGAVTLTPAELARILVPPQGCWPEEEPSELCCNPFCDRRGTQTHHVVRRSITAGAVRWVAIDGLVLCNEIRVCLWCHEELNVHDAWIRYLPGEAWVWYAALPSSPAVRPGDHQHPKSGRWFRPLGQIGG